MRIIPKSYEYLILIAMLYIAVDLSSMVFAYKIIEFGPVIGAASSLIFPLTYSIMDIIAEVYGYSIAKKIICYGFACDVAFAILVLLVSHIPSNNEMQMSTYILIFGPLLRAVFAQIIGVLSGALINIYLISKWKIITNGRYFWLRSIGSSTIGEAVMMVISVLIALTGVLGFAKLFHLMAYTYLYKIFFAIIVSPIISFIVVILKNRIKLDDKNDINSEFLNISNNQDFFPSSQKL